MARVNPLGHDFWRSFGSSAKFGLFHLEEGLSNIPAEKSKWAVGPSCPSFLSS